MTEEIKEVIKSDGLSDDSDDEEKGHYGPTSFTELDELESARDAHVAVAELTDRFLSITRSIMFDPEIEDKGNAVISTAGEFASRVKTVTAKELDGEEWLLDDLKAVWSTKFVNTLPNSSFLHILPGGEKNGDGKTTPRSLRMFPYRDSSGKVDLPHIRNALARIPQSNRIDAVTKSRLTTKARRILKNATKDIGLWDQFKALFGFKDEDEPNDDSFTIWKEGDTTYWLAVYSNNYRDNDNPPEIIASESHQAFVKGVDDGIYPLPELWLWHVKGSRWGEAVEVAYDEDSGFAIAIGTVDPGQEHIAELLGEMKGLGVSHGMPIGSIKRDLDDSSIIVQHRTREISPLPYRAAANKPTSFSILKEGVVDMLPEQKRKFLEEAGFDVEALETALQAKKEELEADKVESKDVETETEETPAEETSVDVVAQLGEIIQAAVTSAVEPLQAEIAGLKEAQAELKTKQDEDFFSLIPAQSLAEIMTKSVIGKDKTHVDGRSSEAKDGPKETDSETVKERTGIPFVDSMLSGQDWRTDFEN